LNGDLPSPVAPPDGFEFRLLNADDDLFIRQIESQERWPVGSLKQRIAKENLCLAALCGGLLAGFHLIAFGQVLIPLVNAQRTFRPGDAWSEQLSVAKDFPGKGVASYLRCRIFEELRRCGVKKLYGGTRRSNLTELKVARAAGFVEVADLEYVRILNFKTWHWHRVDEGVSADNWRNFP